MLFLDKQITTKQINSYFDLWEKKRMTQDLLSENLRTVQDQFGHTKHTVKRDKRFISITEKELWKEYFYMPNVAGSDAEKILTEKYPDIFKYAKKDSELAQQLEAKETEVFGFNAKQLTMANMLKLIGMFTEYARVQRKLHNRLINYYKSIKYYFQVRKAEIEKKKEEEPKKSAKELYYEKMAKGELMHQKATTTTPNKLNKTNDKENNNEA